MIWSAIGLTGGTVRFVANKTLALESIQEGEHYLEAESLFDDPVTFNDAGELIPVILPLSLAKLRKWTDAKIKRNSVIDSGVNVSGIGIFDSDDTSRQNVSGAAIAAQSIIATGGSFSFEWTLKDNSRVSLTAQQILTVHITGVSFINSVYNYAASLRTQIDNATTVGEIDAIDIESGWTA